MKVQDRKLSVPFQGVWHPEEKLGEGSYGTVWKVSAEKDGKKVYAAVKEVAVPASAEVWEEARLEGLDEKSAKMYFRQILDKTLREVHLMQELAECPNIVQFQDYEICECEAAEAFGWVLFIQMELLEPVKNIFLKRAVKPSDVRKIGIDICRALELCAEKGVVHQDIKPDNLFYSAGSDSYKLGDFGIAKQLGRSTAQKGRPGTLSYMSPEVFQGAEASCALDLYALGMVLYRALNHFRMPFLPPYPQSFTPDERDRALLVRLKGREPEAAHLDHGAGMWDRKEAEALERIVRRSIAANPKDRYQSAKAFRNALEAL